MTNHVEMDCFMEVQVCAVIPVLNEEKHIKKCLDSLLSQTMPVQILVVDGGSTDNTLSILEEYGSQIQVLNNPDKRVSQARNLALNKIEDNVTHLLEIIGHSYIDSDHVENRVQDLLNLEKELGKKIGAIGCRTESADVSTDVEIWIEGALSSPIGSGGGQFQKFKGRARTKVPAFCLHNVEALRSVNGWDNRFITSQDSDLSMRLISKGWEVWRSDVSSVYMYKRSSLKNWWKMSHRYGFWRTKVVLKHPNRFDIREVLPLVGLILIFALEKWWYAPVVYASTLLMIGIVYTNHDKSLQSRISSLFGIPLCLIILHTAFTIGLLDGLLRSGRAPNDRT